jgi:hypothetical protein
MVQINVEENRMDNQEWTIKNGQSRETGHVGYTRHRTKNKQKTKTKTKQKSQHSES